LQDLEQGIARPGLPAREFSALGWETGGPRLHSSQRGATMRTPSACSGSRFEVTAMTKTAPFLLSLFTMSVLCSSVVAYAGQTASGTSTAGDQPKTQTEAKKPAQKPGAAQPAADDGTLPVSIDRIKKALTAPEPTGPPIRKELAEGEQPRFVVQTQAPRTLVLRNYLDKGNDVPSYVRPQFDLYHSEFLEMTTPDNYKGCGQYAGDQGACAQVNTSRVASGLVWQQILSRIRP
jgi:hypothetical protein